MIVYDAAGVKTAISPDGSGSVYDANGRRVTATAATANLYSFDNAPTAPSSYDDEFATGSLDAKWTLSSSATTNPVTTGTVNPTASLTTPILDLATCPSWATFQSDNSSGGFVFLTQTVSLATNATLFIKVNNDNRVYSAAGEGSITLALKNNADANEGIYAEVYNVTGAGVRPQMAVENNGVFTTVNGNVVAEGTAQGACYIAVWKSTNTYYMGYTLGGAGGIFTYIGSVTKTGTTTMDRLVLWFRTANETPSSILGVDFVRYYPSITYALMNPAV